MRFTIVLVCLLCLAAEPAAENYADIPFANAVTKGEIETAEFGAYSIMAWSEEARTEGGGVSIKLRGGSLVEHLVVSHKCPRWVAEYYGNSPELLARIHSGYELQFLADDKNYPSSREMYRSRYKILRVTRPRGAR